MRFAAERFGNTVGLVICDKLTPYNMTARQARAFAVNLLTVADAIEYAPIVTTDLARQCPLPVPARRNGDRI